MGRWKGGPNGAYWDANDDGPNQVAPPPGYNADGTPVAAAAAPAAPTQGVTNPGQTGTPQASPPAPAAPPANNGSLDLTNFRGASGQNLNASNMGPQPPQAPGAYQPPTYGSDQYKDYENSVRQWYREFLGREPTDYEAYQWAMNPNGIWTVQSAIMNSPEAAAYKAKQTAAAPAGAAAGGAAAPGGTNYGAMEGVDVNKLYDQSVTSPKYIASRILASGGSLADAAKAIGATVLDGTRMRLSTGETIDTRRDEEGANALQWLVTNDPNAPAAGAPGLGGGGDNSLLAGFSQPFVPPTFGQGNTTGTGGYSDPDYQAFLKWRADQHDSGSGYPTVPATGTGTAGVNPGGDLPSAPAFNYADFDAGPAFVAPDAQTVMNDPGYQFRANEAQRAFLNSASAQGTLRSGGTLQDFLKYGQEMASQEYGNAYQRAKGEYDTQFSNRLTDYTTNRETAQEEYAPQLTDWQTHIKDLREQQDTAYNRAWDQYKTEMDAYYKNQQNAYDRLYGTARLGASSIQ